MATYPIPPAALDDRLACVGTSGSGKTYAMGTAVEKLLQRKVRVIIPDPLGVWWGLRLQADGKTPSRFIVVIFGGPHGDLPLTEHSGALIGEAAATMAESCILDLSELGTKAAERRFMLAFTTALYRKATGEPVHVVFDEADMWAPQQLRDKEGEAAKLLGMMETIVRRGRIKGFIPWLITQRPAVLNKDVLSQVDGVIAMKLTATQDRNALDAWIEGSADVVEAKRIKGDMPSLQLGDGIVWLPSRNVLNQSHFPEKVTFDSSRTPKRGEAKRTHTLKPLDLEKLRGKLATVEAEVAASNPRKLKARIAELEKQVSAKAPAKPAPAVDTKTIQKQTYARGEAEGFVRGQKLALRDMQEAALTAIKSISQTALLRDASLADQDTSYIRVGLAVDGLGSMSRKQIAALNSSSTKAAQKSAAPSSDLSAYQLKILEALAFWGSLGFEKPTKHQVAVAAGASPSSGHFANMLGGLRSGGYVDYPQAGDVALTPAGKAIAPSPSAAPVRERLNGIINGYQQQLLDALPKDGSAMTKDDLADACSVSASSGHFANMLGAMRSLSLITYPRTGHVAVEPWVWR